LSLRENQKYGRGRWYITLPVVATSRTKVASYIALTFLLSENDPS
jgi:hypothetical protein